MTDTARMLGDLAVLVARADRGAPLPVRLCAAAVQLLGADGGSVTLAATEPERLTVFATDGVAAHLEDLQDVLGEGPGLSAYAARAAVVLTVGEDGQSFPVFAEMALQDPGRVTIHAFPMRVGQRSVGVLSVYCRPGSTLARGPQDAQFLADAVGAALLQDPDTHAADAWAERARVHQATGMIVAQLAIGVEDALALLRAHAFAKGTTLPEIATLVVERDLQFSRTDSPADGGSDDSTKIEER